ncbi:MAG: carbon starvation protein A [Flavobacteriales bacterium]|nr:carbon starvation protein A [Flavobacteriales bacterium]
MITFIVCLVLLVVAYFIYGRYIEKVFDVDASRPVPSRTKADGMDYIPLPKWKSFLIELLNIAGLGPIFGAILGATYGPVAFLWITGGCILIGAVHDYASGMISLREGGASFPEIVGKYMGQTVKQVMRVVTIFLITLVGAVFMVGPAGIIASLTGMEQGIWVYIILAYYILATILPIDKIIGRVYPIFGAALIFMALGVIYTIFTGDYNIPEMNFHNYKANAELFPIIPTLFIAIACGAVSGFHSTQSPMMARCIRNEKEGRPVFFGAMIAEGIIALIWAAVGMAFYGGPSELGAFLADNGNNAAVVVNDITHSTLGKIGAILALLGVVVAPITSGDTAFRSARLMIADIFKMEQKTLRRRLYICIPLFVIGFSITLMPFDVLWRYFSWANQVLAVICLWTIAVYLYIKSKNYIIVYIPAVFMTFIVSMYLFFSQEGFQMSYGLSLKIALLITLVITSLTTVYMIKKKKDKKLVEL